MKAQYKLYSFIPERARLFWSGKMYNIYITKDSIYFVNLDQFNVSEGVLRVLLILVILLLGRGLLGYLIISLPIQLLYGKYITPKTRSRTAKRLENIPLYSLSDQSGFGCYIKDLNIKYKNKREIELVVDKKHSFCTDYDKIPELLRTLSALGVEGIK